MDQIMGGEGGGFPLETWFWEMPMCTRWWTTATLLMSGLVQCDLVTPFQLFYSYRAVFEKSQVRSFRKTPTTPSIVGWLVS
jgi:Derlin-2/3